MRNIESEVEGIPLHLDSFDSPLDLLAVCESRELYSGDFTDKDYFDREHPRRPGNPGWCGFSDSADLWDKLLYGISDDSLTRDAMRFATQARVSRDDKLSGMTRNVYGGAVNVPAMMSEDPRCMWCVKRKRVKTRMIHMAVDVSVTSNYTTRDYIETGKEIVRTVARLEKAGYRVSVDVGISVYLRSQRSGSKGRLIAMTMPTKRFNEPMNFRKVLYPLTEPSFFRGVGFGWIVRHPDFNGDGGLGTSARWAFPCRVEDDAMECLYERMFGKDAVVFRMSDLVDRRHGKDGKDLASWIEARLIDVGE